MAKRTKSQSGALSRRKGASFERSVVKALQDAGIACRRNTGQAGSARVQGCDIEDTDFWIECGHGKWMDPRWKYEQAQGDRDSCDDPRPVVVIWKRDGWRSPLVTIGVLDLYELEVGACHHPLAGECQTLATIDLVDWIEMARAYMPPEGR